MKYDEIKHEVENSAAIKLLRSENPALILSFLHKQFKFKQQVSVAQIELETKLGDYLENLQDVYPELSLGLPKYYLNKWCDERLLRKKFNSSDDPVFSLTPASEKAIAWLEDLQKRDEFVGTESRFLQIFSLLKEVQDRSTTDVETRIAQLEQDRDRIQQEIDRIRQTGEVKRYNKTQLKERFILANRLTRQLIADFKEIEQNFRNLTRKVQEAQFEKDSRKGMVIGRVLDADMELRQSDQGQSFYTFLDFFMLPSKREELKSMIENVYQLEELQTLTKENGLLRKIERILLHAGEGIVQSNSQLAEKLRQMLDERNLQENRRVADLIAEVQRLALQVDYNTLTDSDFWTLEGEPAVYLAMARPLHPLEKPEVPTFSFNFTDSPNITLDEEIAELFQQFYVDEDLLAQRIDGALEHCSTIALTDLIELYPVTQGLAEIVAYLAIATQSDRHSINTSTIDSITIASLDPETQLQLRLPQIIFRR